MNVIASYFDSDQAAIAADALTRAGIPFEQRQVTGEDVETIEFSVGETDADRACGIIEKLEEILVRKSGSAPVECPKCGSSNLLTHHKDGAFGRHTVYLCRDCGNVVVH